uniref:Uncharacterized protein n=1 Tax=Clastoptera arizonana TaxID=38151 RepID=A0A1B6E9Q7_9HEMI
MFKNAVLNLILIFVSLLNTSKEDYSEYLYDTIESNPISERSEESPESEHSREYYEVEFMNLTRGIQLRCHKICNRLFRDLSILEEFRFDLVKQFYEYDFNSESFDAESALDILNERQLGRNSTDYMLVANVKEMLDILKVSVVRDKNYVIISKAHELMKRVNEMSRWLRLNEKFGALPTTQATTPTTSKSTPKRRKEDEEIYKKFYGRKNFKDFFHRKRRRFRRRRRRY